MVRLLSSFRVGLADSHLWEIYGSVASPESYFRRGALQKTNHQVIALLISLLI